MTNGGNVRDIQTIILRIRADLPVSGEEIAHAQEWLSQQKRRQARESAILLVISLVVVCCMVAAAFALRV